MCGGGLRRAVMIMIIGAGIGESEWRTALQLLLL